MSQDSSDIVFRLREAAKTMRAHKAASFEASELDCAAEEIERLRLRLTQGKHCKRPIRKRG